MANVNYVWGAPGTGKSTFLAYLTYKELKKRKPRTVYSNTYIKGAVLISDKDIGKYSFENGLVLLDEAGITYNNRDFKHGMLSDPDRLYWWKYVRHYNCEVYIATQGWDEVDKKLRTLSGAYYLCKKCIIPCFSVVKRVYKKCDIDELTHEPTDFYNFGMIFDNQFIFRRKYYKLFDSFERKELPNYI